VRRADKERAVKALNEQELAALFEALAADWDVRVPIRLHDGTRALGRPGEGPLALAGGALPRKITSVFFPQMERVFTAGGGAIEAPAPGAKPLLVVGFTAQDLDCLEFIDRFFGEHFRDHPYFARRQGAATVGVSGRCGRDGAMLKIAAGKCDLELVCDGKRYIAAARSEAGAALAGRVAGGQEVAQAELDALQALSDALPRDDEQLIAAAAALLQQNKVPDEFWQSVADRCIACTSCNLCCPTCTCFEVFDRSAGAARTDRWRMWDSCQLDGFMREASGHNPMGAEWMRTRRRIHHKLAADPARWGQVTCFLCGRCDEVCPTGIGIKAVCREMLARYGGR